MAKRTPKPGGLMVLLGGIALIADLVKARQHQQTCPKCLGRDYLEIALDVAHLWAS
jgi:hypothetical protein